MYDQGALIRSGMAIVPDYAQQQAAKEQQRLLRSQHELQQQKFAQKQQELTDFKTAVDVYQRSGSPQDLVNLMARFPEQSQGLKRAFDAQDTEKRTSDLRHTTELYGYMRSGRFDKAAESLERRMAAEREAGLPPDPADEQVLADLKSGDPAAQKAAMAQTGMMVAVATGPDKFASTYGELNPEAKLSPVMREYQDRVAQFGKQAADNWLAVQDTKLIPVTKGGTVYSTNDLVGGGGSSSGYAPVPDHVSNPGAGRNNAAFEALIQQESGGRPGILGPQTKYGRAVGLTQMLPSTARQVAKNIGVPFRMDLLKGKSQEAANYQRRLGRAYFEEALENTGSLREALMYYHGGPNRKIWGKKTKAYAASVLRRMKKGNKPVSKKVGGKTYYQIGGKWYDNPEGQ